MAGWEKQAIRRCKTGFGGPRPGLTAIMVVVASLHVGCATVRPVEQGQVYTAARISTPVFGTGRLPATQLEAAIKDNRIRTVVNFNAFDPQSGSYREQLEVCHKAGIKHIDLFLNPQEPDREEVIRLLETFRTVEKPILFQSSPSGGEAGFAAALYRLAIIGESKDRARKELAFWESYRQPIARFREHDRFLQEWTNERDFYARYQLSRQRDWPSGLSEIRPVAPSLPSTGRRVLAGANPADNATVGTILPMGLPYIERMFDNRPAEYTMATDRSTASGTVLRDYSAVIVNGPIAAGPVLLERRSLVAKPKPGDADRPKLGLPTAIMPREGAVHGN